MQATAVMLKGKKASGCDDVVGQKIQVTATMLMEIYASDCGNVEGQKS
jgi:hypothetical protein